MILKSAIETFLDRSLDSWDWLKKLSKEDLLKELNEVAPGLTFKTDPFAHQLVCFLISLYNNNFLYFVDLGGGKSFISLSILTYLKKKGNLKRCLILVPYTITISSWEEQIKKHSDLSSLELLGSSEERWKLLETTKHTDIVTLSYPGFTALVTEIHRSRGRGKRVINKKLLNELCSYFNVVIYDELHRLKNKESLIWDISNNLSSVCSYRYGLTGTPFGRNPIDFWAQFYLIDRGETFGINLTLFREAFFKQIMNPWGPEWVFRKAMTEKLSIVLKNKSIRYAKDELNDLPEKVYIKKILYFPKITHDYYKKAVKGVIEAKGNYKELDNAFTKLRQITSGFLKFKSNEGEDVELVFDENPKLEALEELLDAIGNEKIVVFNDYIKTGDIICERLLGLKIKHERLYSGTQDKIKSMQNFINDKDCRVYVINSASGSLSLNLQENCRYTLFYESPLSSIVRQQAGGRVHRTGQKHRVFEYDFIIKGSIDERIISYNEQGKDLLTELLDRPEVLLED